MVVVTIRLVDVSGGGIVVVTMMAGLVITMVEVVNAKESVGSTERAKPKRVDNNIMYYCMSAHNTTDGRDRKECN